MPKYTVYVDDNFHFMDESERYKHSEYDTYDAAVAACKKIVESYFEPVENGKYSFKELWDGYTTFGEDPFIVPEDKDCHFSAWDYAKQRCHEMAGR